MTLPDLAGKPGPLAPWALMVGDVSPIVRASSGYMDENGNVVAFRQFVQYLGPPVAHYDACDGEKQKRYRYQVFAWWSDDPTKITARLGRTPSLRRGSWTRWRRCWLRSPASLL